MKIEGINIGKKFGKTWIFRNQNFIIESGTKTAILGKNGAGKSTILQIISGYLTQSCGAITLDGKNIVEHHFQASYVGPYTEIIEEFTLAEFLEFHQKFRKPICSLEEMAEAASIPLNKVIGDFSTGMKQRAKLITSFYFENEGIFFDEPTSNLDDEGFQWWMTELGKLERELIIIASNDERELSLCENKIKL